MNNENRKNSYVTVEVLQNMLETVKEEYLKSFVDKYDFDIKDAYWTGHVLCVADYFLDFYDVVYAVNNSVPDEKLFNWYDYSLTVSEFLSENISLESYVKEYRPYKEHDVKELRRLQTEYNKTKSSLEDLTNRMKNANQRN